MFKKPNSGLNAYSNMAIGFKSTMDALFQLAGFLSMAPERCRTRKLTNLDEMHFREGEREFLGGGGTT